MNQLPKIVGPVPMEKRLCNPTYYRELMKNLDYIRRLAAEIKTYQERGTQEPRP